MSEFRFLVYAQVSGMHIQAPDDDFRVLWFWQQSNLKQQFHLMKS